MSNVILQIFHSWVSKRILGRMRESKVTGTGEVGSGCYLTLIARAMNPELGVIQKYYVPGRDMGIEHLRQGHYIEGGEKKGFIISKMDISLPDQRLKLFTRGRTDW